MKLNEKVVKMIYRKGMRRDQVAEELGLSGKIVRMLEREYIKKMVRESEAISSDTQKDR